MLIAGADSRASDTVSYSANCTYSQSSGNTVSGLVLAQLPVIDGSINNTVSSLSPGMQYQLSPKLRLSGPLDYYTDDAFNELTGGPHWVIVGMSYAF